MELRYINSRGVELNLTQWPYMYNSGDVYDFVWSYDMTTGVSNQITEFYKGPLEKPIKIAITADTREDFVNAVNHLTETIDVDVINMVPGKLFVGEQYLKCYIRGIKKAKFNAGIDFTFCELNVVVENPNWITETTKSFTSAGGSAGTGLDYPHDYPRDYSPKVLADSVVNDNYSPIDFRMVIYGPAVNPEVTIGNNTYKVFTELIAGEYLAIDSQEHIVAQFDNLGGSTTKYNSRDKTCEIYEQIPSGVIPVLWSGGFGFDLTTYAKRSEPKWIL